MSAITSEVAASHVGLSIAGKLDAKLDVIPEEGSSATTPHPREDQGEGPEEEATQHEESEEPVKEVGQGESEKMDLSEAAQVEHNEESGEQVCKLCQIQNGILYISTFPFQSPEDQPSSSACSLKSEEGATLKVPLMDDRRLSEGDILNVKSSKRHKPSSSSHSRSQPVSPHAERSNRNKRDPSPTPSSSSETSSLVEQATASRPPPPPCTLGEKVSLQLYS